MAKRNYLILISSFAGLSIFSVANANNYYCNDRMPVCATGGIVIGAQGGYADTHWDNIDDFGSNNPLAEEFFPDVATSTSKDDGFVARGYLGLVITPFFGIESGYTYLPNADTTVVLDDGSVITGNIKNYAIDLLAKLMIPVVDGFSVYAKAGAAYFHSKLEQGNSVDPSFEDDVSHIGPAYGVGAAYEIIPNLALDLSWMRYSGDNHIFNGDGSLNNQYQPNPDMLLLGISYKFPLYSYAY